MKKYILIILMFSMSIQFINAQRNQTKGLFATMTYKSWEGVYKGTGENQCYINVNDNDGKSNLTVRKPGTVRGRRVAYSTIGSELLRIVIENPNTGYEYEILPNSSSDKKITLEPGRYKVTLFAKVSSYRDSMNRHKNGVVAIQLEWLGKKD